MGVPLATVSKRAKFESPDLLYWCYKGYAVANVDDQIAMAKMYPDMNTYWNYKRADVGKVEIPVYQIAGWSHFHLSGSLNAWRRCRSHLKWMRAHRDFEWPDTYNPENLEDLLRYYVSRATVDTALTKAHTPVYTMTDTNKLAEGEVRTVDIAIVPTARVYHKGERFRAQISGRYIRDGWFKPLSWDTENHGTHNIHIGGEWESWIEVPVVPPRYQAGEYIHRSAIQATL